MAHDDNAKWELPAPLRITNPLVKLQADEMRKQLEPRAVSPFARLSPTEFARLRARGRIQHLTQSLQTVEQQLQASRGVEEHRNLNEAKRALQARLAENLAVIGNFALAAEIAPDKAHRDEYAAKARASVERPVFP